MSDLRLIEAVKAEDLSGVKELIAAGADVNQQDEHLWTPLNWAAGKGNLDLVSLLIEKGADPSRVGRDERTPYMIALAAGHAETARFLRAVEERAGKRQPPERKYCKAYLLEDLRRFPGWSENELPADASPDEQDDDLEPEESDSADLEIGFLHQDYTVTRSMQQGEEVIFDRVTPEWRDFCDTELKFKVPDDLDLLVPSWETGRAAST